MGNTFMPAFKDIKELEAHQLKGLQWTVKHVYQGSPFYRKRLDDAGVTPEDIHTLDDIQKLPYTTADDLREGYPFPLLSVHDSQVVRIHASSGTTGKRKVLAYTQKDIDDWLYFFARCYEMAELCAEDRVQIAVGYGIWTAGFGFQLGCEKFGAMALPVGPGNVDMQCQFLVDLQSTVMCCGFTINGDVLHRLYGIADGRRGEQKKFKRQNCVEKNDFRLGAQQRRDAQAHNGTIGLARYVRHSGYDRALRAGYRTGLLKT
jgi:phenylacetate-coenzyme A ligase PaaK-like adenylate-forming protein